MATYTPDYGYLSEIFQEISILGQDWLVGIALLAILVVVISRNTKHWHMLPILVYIQLRLIGVNFGDSAMNYVIISMATTSFVVASLSTQTIGQYITTVADRIGGELKEKRIEKEVEKKRVKRSWTDAVLGRDIKEKYLDRDLEISKRIADRKADEALKREFAMLDDKMVLGYDKRQRKGYMDDMFMKGDVERSKLRKELLSYGEPDEYRKGEEIYKKLKHKGKLKKFFENYGEDESTYISDEDLKKRIKKK